MSPKKVQAWREEEELLDGESLGPGAVAAFLRVVGTGPGGVHRAALPQSSGLELLVSQAWGICWPGFLVTPARVC